VLERFVSDT